MPSQAASIRAQSVCVGRDGSSRDPARKTVVSKQDSRIAIAPTGPRFPVARARWGGGTLLASTPHEMRQPPSKSGTSGACVSAGRRVVVTGMGVVTPIGGNLASFWHALRSGRSGVDRIRSFDASGFDTRIAAEVKPRDARGRWRPHGPPRPERKLLFLLDALEESLRCGRLVRSDAHLARAAVVLGSELGRPNLPALARSVLRHGGWVPDYRQSAPHVGGSVIAERIHSEGPVVNVSLACSSSAAAVAHAMDLVRDGVVELAVVGGADDQVDPIGISTFSILGVLSRRNDAPRRASRPFDADRDGFVMGEGAGVVILESLASARERRAPIFAELSGYGISANAFSVTDSPPDGGGASEAMEAALADARRRPGEIDYINAHGTSTVDNDVSEALAIRRSFGQHACTIAVSSTKSQMGHLIAAAGVVELIVSILALRHSIAPPTINLENPDRRCRLAHVANRARRLPLRRAMTNSFGFGGTNVSIVVERMVA